MYKLYTFARSSTVWRARIALNLKNIHPEFVYVHLFKGYQRSEAYQKINPNMGVPTLVLPNGVPIVESMAIIEYLNEAHPTPHNLFPGSAVYRAQIRGFCEVINSGIHPYQNLRLLYKIYKDYKGDKAVWLDYWLKKGLTTIYNMLINCSKNSPFVFGNNLSAADIFLYPQVMSSKNRFKIDILPYKNVCKVLGNLQQMKYFQDSYPEKQKDFE